MTITYIHLHNIHIYIYIYIYIYVYIYMYIYIDKTDGSDPTRWEEYWHMLLKTVVSYELKRIEYGY